MWRWQRRSVRRGHALWAKLCGISLTFHLLFAAWFFGVEHNGVSLAFVVRAAATPRTPTASLCLYSLPEPVAKAAVVAPTKTAAAAKPKAPVTLAAKKPEQKKQPQKVAAKKEEPKKQDTKVAKKADPPKPVAKKVETPQPQKVAAKKQPGPVKAAPVEQTVASEEVLGAQLQQTVMAHWAPPPGVDDACFCTLAFRVDWGGEIQDVEVREASGVLMYDIAAKCALNETKLPSWARGKNLTITFRQ